VGLQWSLLNLIALKSPLADAYFVCGFCMVIVIELSILILAFFCGFHQPVLQE
jgi:hypothetical protein